MFLSVLLNSLSLYGHTAEQVMIITMHPRRGACIYLANACDYRLFSDIIPGATSIHSSPWYVYLWSQSAALCTNRTLPFNESLSSLSEGNTSSQVIGRIFALYPLSPTIKGAKIAETTTLTQLCLMNNVMLHMYCVTIDKSFRSERND